MNIHELKMKTYKALPEFIKFKIAKDKVINKGDNVLQYGDSFIRKTVFEFGKNSHNNKIIIGDNCHLSNCKFEFYGSDSIVIIGNDCVLCSAHFWMEDNDNKIEIGNKTTVSGATSFAAIEGTNITVGEDCMFSSNITLRTSDSHSVLQNGVRINPSQDISIGNHVWVCEGVLVLKGSRIGNNSIVGAKALVCSTFNEDSISIVGIPAKKVKNEINWERERI